MEVAFSSAPILNEELRLMSDLIDRRDIEKLISRYPLRETPALELIARKSLFPSKEKYEQAVRKMLIDSNETLQMMRGIIQPATRLLS